MQALDLRWTLRSGLEVELSKRDLPSCLSLLPRSGTPSAVLAYSST